LGLNELIAYSTLPLDILNQILHDKTQDVAKTS